MQAAIHERVDQTCSQSPFGCLVPAGSLPAITQALSSPIAAANQGQLSHAKSIAPVSQLAAATFPSASLPDCEHKVLQLLGWQQAYNPNGYSINAELPPNCSLQTWQSLGCLKSLTNLTLTGSLFNLPDAWATNGSFLTLQAVNLSTAQLGGPLPDTWGQGAAFPQLRLLKLSTTELSGTLPAAWAQTGAFSQLVELHLDATNISGIVLLCTYSAVGSIQHCEVSRQLQPSSF